MPETATSSLFGALPKLDDLQPQLTQLPSRVTPPRLGTDVGALKDGLVGSIPASVAAGPGVPAPDLSGAPSPAAFRRALDAPLGRLQAVDGRSLVESARGPLPVAAPAPGFKINDAAQQITGAVLPAAAAAPVRTDARFPAELGDFTGPLRRLSEAGAATPLRMLHVLLTVLDRFVAQVSDRELLKRYTAESVGEILVAQCQTLRAHLPLASTERARTLLDEDFLARYESLLNDLDRVQASSGPDLIVTLQAVRERVLPALRDFEHAARTLGYLNAGDTAPLRAALEHVTGFASGDEVMLQPFFDEIEGRVETVLEAVKGPVTSISGMIDAITTYLTAAANKAEAAADAVSKKLVESIRSLVGELEEARQTVVEVEKEVAAFIERVDVAPAVDSFKEGCTRVADSVDDFFTEVERARKELDDTVRKMTTEVDAQFTSSLEALEKRIRELLDDIVAVLNRPEVASVLEQARTGIEKLKTTIDEASLQAVFDLVVGKTGELQGRIQALDTSRLGTPQKTALKVGAKVIEAVKVDEVIRPELEDAFRQIVEPLRELVALLKDKVLVIEQEIDRFNPGSLVTREVEPYLRPVFDALDSFRPGKLLEPLKEALEFLAGIVEKLDPQRLLDQLQGAYAQLGELVRALEPGPLNTRISEVANRAIAQLTQVREQYLEDLVRTIRESVSLQKLLEGTGVQEIADAEFWTLLRRTLGGEQLNALKKAVGDAETELAAEFSSLDYGDAAAEVRATLAAVDAQIRVAAPAFRSLAGTVRASLEVSRARVGDLERRRAALLAAGPVRPEVAQALAEMELQPLVELLASLQGVAAATEAATGTALGGVKTVLQEGRDELAALDENAIRMAVPAIFKRQFGDPVRAFVNDVQARLLPFVELVNKVQTLVDTTLTELPKQIDAKVGAILARLKKELGDVLETVIAAIRAARDALTGTLTRIHEQVRKNVEKLDPTLVLNLFAPGDFMGAGGTGAAPGLLLLAGKIGTPGGDRVAALLQSKLAPEQRTLVETRAGDYRKVVLDALNAALRDDELARQEADDARTRLENDARTLRAALETAQGADWIAARKALLRNGAMTRQLGAARKAYDAPATRDTGRIRLNRVILEVNYPDALKMGLLGLHPFVVEQVAALYPEETVALLDATYAGMVLRVRGLPDRLVRAPLDDAFAKVKTTLRAKIDIQGLFRVLDIKLDGMEDDLGEGLDRLSLAYERLLTTLDSRLSA